MKTYQIALVPFRNAKHSLVVGVKGLEIFVALGPGRLLFALDGRLLSVLVLALLAFAFYPGESAEKQVFKVVADDPLVMLEDLMPPELPPLVKKQLVGSFYEDRLEVARDVFLREKQKLLFERVVEEKVAMHSQLSEEGLLAMHKEISRLFKDLVLKNVQPQPHVWQFFTDTTDLSKLETALMEQAQYHIPASVTLAQAAVETAWGQHIAFNNYFGLKAKGEGQKGTIVTTEFLAKDELNEFSGRILAKTKVVRNGKVMYKCTVKDQFAKFRTPWASFRGRSEYLANNPRYAPLFTGGKDYVAWANRLGAVRDGGVGYATSPGYGQMLKRVIERYHLHLLDH